MESWTDGAKMPTPGLVVVGMYWVNAMAVVHCVMMAPRTHYVTYNVPSFAEQYDCSTDKSTHLNNPEPHSASLAVTLPTKCQSAGAEVFQ